MIDKLSTKSDSFGALASGLCLVHCIVTPFIFAMQPISAHVEDAPAWWSSLDYIFLTLSFLAVFWSVKNSTKTWVKYALWVSLAVLSLAIFNEKFELYHLGELVVYIPAMSLVGLHLYNRKHCQCESETCPVHHH
jgi:multidrug transporter EmrE-like cation transporter